MARPNVMFLFVGKKNQKSFLFSCWNVRHHNSFDLMVIQTPDLGFEKVKDTYIMYSCSSLICCLWKGIYFRPCAMCKPCALSLIWLRAQSIMNSFFIMLSRSLMASRKRLSLARCSWRMAIFPQLYWSHNDLYIGCTCTQVCYRSDMPLVVEAKNLERWRTISSRNGDRFSWSRWRYGDVMDSINNRCPLHSNSPPRLDVVQCASCAEIPRATHEEVPWWKYLKFVSEIEHAGPWPPQGQPYHAQNTDQSRCALFFDAGQGY
jgi:hypothetical protein